MKKSKKHIKIVLLTIVLILISILGYSVYSASTGCDINTYMAIYGHWVSGSIGSWDGKAVDKYIHCTGKYDDKSCTYHDEFLNKTDKKGYLGQTVGYPDQHGGKSDYGYVAWYNQVWCLSEGQINSTDTTPLRVYGIIEIGTSSNPTYTKLYHFNGKDKSVQNGVAGISESRRAQAAFTMLVGSDYDNDNVTGVAQKHFYDTFASALKTKTYLKRFYDDAPRSNTSVKSSVTINGTSRQYSYDSYAQEISDINTPIDKSNYKNLKCENKSFTNSGLSMKTLIEGTRDGDSNVFNMSSNSNLVTSRKMILTKEDGSKITYNIKKDGSKWFLYSGSTKKGRITISTGKIYLVEEVQIKKVEIEISYKYIHGVLYMLGGRDTQTRGISKGKWETGTMSSSLNVAVEEEKTDVSMQKYIVEVNGKSLGKDENGYNLRASTKTVSDESDKGLVKDNNFKKPADGSKYNVKNFYKGANPVEINVGDKVTYKISIYNNTKSDAYDVRLEDRLPFFYENLGEVTVEDEDENGNTISKTKTKYKINTAAEVESIKMGSKDVTEDFTDKRETKSENSKSIYTGSFKRIVYTIDKLKAGDEVYFEVTLSFNTQLKDKVLTNSAFIYCDGNKKTYRTTDRDYVKMVGSYQVSLEKFVSKVNGQNITGRTGTNNATAESEAVSKYRFNEAMKADGEGKIDTLNGNNILDSKKKELNNLHFTKYNNAVSVDSGDTVTFTIRLRNTGNSPVKITKIYDSFRFVEEGTYNGVKLKFDSATGVTGNGGGEITDDHYGSDEDNNKNKRLDRYLIAFDNAVLLNNKNDYVDINMTYTVEIPTELTGENLILQNKAKIVTLENKNNVAVSDEDGADNNADMDFLTNKKYSVSLEKYVSKVTSKDKQNTYDSDGRKDHRHNESVIEGHKERDPYKAEVKNRIPVEIGDTVQYTIKLTNTGENPVKITQIYDTFGYVADNSFSVLNPDETKNVGLKFVKAETSSGYTITLDNLEYSKDTIKNRFNRYLFSISGNSIEPNESIYVYMTYEVDIPFDITDKEYSLFNKAGIIEAGIKNEKGNTVKDSDSTDNNFDMDWIKTQIYKVSLKKYVSKVTDKNGNNELNYDRSETRFNAYAQDKTNIDNYNSYKKDNPVMVEAGDKVTYTIILKNEGDTSIKINELYDYYSNKGLSYDTTIGIKGNGNGYISETTNKDPQDRNSTDVTKYKILFRDPITLAAGKSTKLEITFNVTSNEANSIYCNVARVENILNKNDIEVKDADGPDNNTDEDWIKLKGYAVSLEKYVYQVNNKNLSEDVAQREGRAEYLTYKDGRYVDETANDSEYTVHNSQKYNKAVTVPNGSSVTYKVKVTNNGDTNVYIAEIEDYLPDGIIYNGTTYNDGQYCTNAADSQTDNEVKFTDLADTVIEPGTSKTLTIDVDKVIEPANSNNILKNVAQISKIKNRNGVEVEDTTPNNNRDADYIVLNYEPDPDSEYVDYNVEKVWVDGNNVEKKRPSEITVKLYRDGVKLEEVEELKLNASNGWKGQWTNLDKADENGKSYSYTAIENPVSGYSAKHEHSASGTTITNTRDTITKTVRKVWKDEAGKQITDTSKLSEITVKIYQNGTEYGTVKLNNSNSWKYTWTLPEKDDNGNLYTYDVKEVNVPAGYIASYTPDGEGIIITNTKGTSTPEKVTKTVRKVWQDEDGKEISNTSSFGTIRVQLTRDGVPMNGYVAELKSSNNWSHTWKDLAKANGSNEYQYSVKELNVPEGYTVNVTPSVDEIIVTNKQIKDEPETISKTVNKVWLDANGNKTEGSGSIKVQLYKDGTKQGGEITLKANNNWSYTWNNLPKYDSKGNEHTYTVKEVNVPEGYDDIYVGDGFTIQNKQIEYTEITVKKAWVDNNDEVGKRPSSVKVQLYKGNNKVGSEITLNEKNKWTYTWGEKEKLLKADDYDVREVTSTEGYKVSYVVQDSTFIIKNEYTDNPGVNPPDDPDLPDPPTPDLPGDSVIAGYVWNDEALNKVQTAYNGEYDLEEDPIYGVNVKLYRIEDEKVVATATTNINGYYGFSDADLALNADLAEEEKFIKGKRLTYIDPETGKKEVSNVWASYYSYYVVFEYNGITYTSTEYSKYGSNRDDLLSSNAREKLNNEEYDGKVVQSRTDFNARYDKINNQGAFRKYIEGDKYWNGNHNKTLIYDTMNVDSYIPASITNLNKSIERSLNYWINQGFSEEEAYRRAYEDNTKTIYMQSSTEKIELSAVSDIDLNLKHVNIGLRGKDIFDLELTSDVAQIDVKINNQQGVYKYANKVTLRKQDIVINDDMANVRREPSNTYVDTQEQRIRQTDMPALDEIKVTYKITVHNTSPTAGTATLITNYYDDEYTFERAYSGNITLASEEGESGTGYKSRVIETPKTKLEQGNTMDIYVVYKLNNPSNTLKDLDRLATYNLAEITEYTTERGFNQTEYTRGLVDKDSAPGSANTEKVRLTTTESNLPQLTNGNPTTVQYYFSGQDLSVFKYEDDTFATPTLYFVKDGSVRKVTGKVFDDKTTVDPDTRIKTGNGKLDEGEIGIYGAEVYLIEINDDGTTKNTIGPVRTDVDGNFKFEGFLPGQYKIQYYYGNTTDAVLLNQGGTGVNGKSYNGEDFQSTNNTGANGALKLNSTENYWYVYNEKDEISTATDDITRRSDVSNNVVHFKDEQMTVLNNMRDGIEEEASEVEDIMNNTWMTAETYKMLFTVEKTENLDSLPNSAELLRNNRIIAQEREDGLRIAQWAVFPGAIEEYKEYTIRNMHFGIAEVPVTTVDLQKHVSAFTITDSTGNNVIASMELKEDGSGWKLKGDVLPNLNDKIDVSIENEELQGARLEITYKVIANMNTEVNFDGQTRHIVPTITGIVDFVDNNLSYNEKLGENSTYWEVTTYDYIHEKFAEQEKFDNVTPPEGTVDPTGTKYTTILKAKENNPLLLTAVGRGEATITLEKVLTSTDSGIEEIITSTLDTSAYNNIVEIVGFDYLNTGAGAEGSDPTLLPGGGIDTDGDGNLDLLVMRDRIRRPDRRIIIPGVQHDYATSEILVIHPPTGDSSISMIYLLVAIISLGILAAGVFGIKKFVIKK